jgi:hypothetical protein
MNAIRAKTRILPWLSFRVFPTISVDSRHRVGANSILGGGRIALMAARLIHGRAGSVSVCQTELFMVRRARGGARRANRNTLDRDRRGGGSPGRHGPNAV